MSRFKKVGTGTLEYISEVGCVNDCSKTIPINKGLPLPCKEFTNFESSLLRRRALKDEQLFASGFTKIVDRSAIGDDLRIKGLSIDIGEIRTEANGARSLRECKYNYEGITIDEWEKRFYVVNTNKHLKLCPRDFVGTSLQDLIGDKMTEFDDFQDTDLADILVGAIIEKYNTEFVAKFILLAVFDNEGENMNGDDGIFAKAYYAWKNQYFHTLQYDLSQLVSGTALVAIVGGNQFSQNADPDVNMTLLAFVDWINTLKEGREYLYNTSVDLATKKVTVVSKFATTKIRLHTGIIDEGEEADWSGVDCAGQTNVPTVCLQNSMPINDTPLMFKYEEINESNFVALFKRYLKEFTRYLHRNGFTEISMDDVKIGIDPELMLERDDALTGNYLAGNLSIDFMEQIGLSASKFVPMNALNNTGFFFMTIEENILVLGDTSNEANGLPGTGTVKVADVCDGQFSIIFDNPIGSAMEHFGASAFNLCDSYFVTDNDLDNREPYANTRATLMCYSDACRDNQLTVGCNISATVASVIAYDGGADETTITVAVDVANPNNVPHILYDLGYSLSDGTGQTGITLGTFVITLPGDQTASGLVLNVFGQVAGTDTIVSGEIANTYCVCNVVYSVQLGDSSAIQECSYFYSADLNNDVDQLGISYVLGGGATAVPFVDAGLDLSEPADWAAIEDEIEAILPGSTVVLSDNAANPGLFTDISITGVLDDVTSVTIQANLGGLASSYLMARTCA